MQKKRRKMEEQNVCRWMRKEWCNNTRYLSQPCSSDCCSFEEIICIWGAVIAPLITCGIFYLILKLRRSLELLRKVVTEIKMSWTIFLPSSSDKDEIPATGFKEYRNLPHHNAHLLSKFRALPCPPGPISYSWEEKKGLLLKAWVSAINYKSLALHSTEPHGVNISFSLYPLHLRFTFFPHSHNEMFNKTQ